MPPNYFWNIRNYKEDRDDKNAAGDVREWTKTFQVTDMVLSPKADDDNAVDKDDNKDWCWIETIENSVNIPRIWEQVWEWCGKSSQSER